MISIMQYLRNLPLLTVIFLHKSNSVSCSPGILRNCLCKRRRAKLIDILESSFFLFVASIPTLPQNLKSHLYFLGILYIMLCCKGVVITTSMKKQNKNTKFNTQNWLKIESNTVYLQINFQQRFIFAKINFQVVLFWRGFMFLCFTWIYFSELQNFNKFPWSYFRGC